MHTTLRALLLAALLAAFGHGHAQTAYQGWPARPVRFIVSFAAGAAPDIVCRVLTEQLSRKWARQVIVDNRPGSGNIIGAQAAARADPDGYTFFATAAPLVTNPYTFKSLPYDPVRDFVSVAMVGKAPFVILAHPGVPVRTLAELIALDKRDPGKLAFATDGPRNFSGLVAAWLNKLAGTGILAVPYANNPQGIQDTLAGRTQLVILALASAAPHISRGALKPLAVSSARRVPGFDGIPSVAETFTGFDLLGWFAVLAPAGTPTIIVRRLNRDLDAVLSEPEIVQRLRELGVFTEGTDTPEGANAFIRAERATWGKVIKEIGIEPE